MLIGKEYYTILKFYGIYLAVIVESMVANTVYLLSLFTAEVNLLSLKRKKKICNIFLGTIPLPDTH